MREYGSGYWRNSRRRDLPKVTLKDVSIRRIFALFKPYQWNIAFILVIALTSAVIGLGPPLVMKEIIDSAIPDGNKKLLLQMVSLMVLLPLSSGLLGVLQNYLNTKVGQSVMRDLRHKLFNNLQMQSMTFFTNSRSGEVIQRVTGDVQMVQSVISSLIVSSVTQTVIVSTTLIILFSMDWKLAILSVLILPIFIFPVGKVGKLRQAMRLEAQQIRSEMTSHLNESFGVSGALLTRIFSREQMQQERFDELNEKSMGLELKVVLVGRWYGMFTGLLAPIGAAMIYLYGGVGTMNGTMTIGSIVAFAAYLGRLYSPVTSLLNLHIEVNTALAIFQRIFEYKDMKPDIHDAPDAKELPTIRGHISFANVSFAYKQPDELALNDVSFTAKPGQLVALVGTSGAGKSTLISMIARLYDPLHGQVLIDGYDLRKVTLASLRSQMAFVTQETFLLHASIKDNLRFADSNATQQQMEDACKKAHIHDLIMSLSDGYEAIVGERGNRLSGGERQRIAIARAILKNPKVLVLDEATSHLDSHSEWIVKQALEALMKNRTTIVIAHRLSTILSADQILVMDNGKIIEQGTHEELLSKGGMYSDLYNTQYSRALGGE